MFKKQSKTFLSGSIALMTVASLATFNVFAAMTAPAAPLTTDNGVVKCAGAGATGVMIEMLGGDLVGAASVHLSTDSMPLFMPVFGTANNESPDPWLYNAYYNTVSSSPVSNASSHAYVAANGPGTMDTTTVVNGTIPILLHRPDFIIGTESELAQYVLAVPASENYKPYYGIGAGMATPEQILKTVLSYAKGMQDVIDTSNGKLKGRYGNPAEIGEKFAEFFNSSMDYCTAKIEALNKPVVKAITVTGVSNNDWTVQDGSAADVFNEYIKKAGGEAIGQKDTIMTTAELLEANVLLTSTTALKTAIATAFDSAGYKLDQIPAIYHIPKGVYGWNLRSPEGALSVPWLTSVFYPELATLPEINPVYTTAYFYANFYHYTGNLEEIIGVVLTENNLVPGLTVDLSNWDSTIVPGKPLNASQVSSAVVTEASAPASAASASAEKEAASAPSGTTAVSNPTTGSAMPVSAAAAVVISAAAIAVFRRRKQ